MASRQPIKLGDALSGLIDRMGIRRRLNEANAVDAWAIVAGAQVAGVTDSVWLRGGKLFVKITSSAWRQELHLQRDMWRDKVNRHLGADIVKEIVFR